MGVTNDYGWTHEQPESSGYINPYILKELKTPGATVLDAGCGNGALCGELARNGFVAIGVDADVNGIDIARQRHPGATFAAASFLDDPRQLIGAPAVGFDYVVSTEVVEHLYVPHELATYAFRALKPGGQLIISTPYHGYFKNMALSIFDTWDHHHTALWHGGHIKFWSFATLSTLLQDAGFVVQKKWGTGRLPFLWKSMVMTAVRPVGQ